MGSIPAGSASTFMIENKVFDKHKCLFNSLQNYGFVFDGSNYIFEKLFLNDEFKAIISISKLGDVKGKVIEVALNDEYTNLRLETLNGAFVNEVREEYANILLDICKHCFTTQPFIYEQSNRIAKEIEKAYGDLPEFLWEDDDSGVFRNKKANKWYGIIMHINKKKLCSEDKDIEAMNIKLNPKEIDELVNNDGFYRAYHMNKKYWITISLDETLEDKIILNLIDKSYKLVD